MNRSIINYYFVAAIAVVAVLLSSDGNVVGTWAGGVQPSTFIAIAALLSNSLLAFAFSRGLILSYWRTCLHGTSLENLHYSWNAGQSILGAGTALLRGRHGSINALALIVLTLCTVRSPLNQAASGVENDVVFQNGTLDLQVSRWIPEYYTGVIESSRTSGTTTTSALSQKFSTIVREFNARLPMKLGHADCGDTCDVVVNTFGFCAACSSETLSINPRLQTDLNDYFALFSVDIDLWEQEVTHKFDPMYGGLIFHVLYVSEAWNANGNSTQINETCYLQPSVMAVPVRLARSNDVTLQGRWSEDECVRPLNYKVPQATWGGAGTTIGGFLYFLQNTYTSSASFVNRGSTAANMFSGLIANQYLKGNDGIIDIATGGRLAWSNPTDDILDALREVSFRTSLFTAGNSTQTVSFRGSSNYAIYRTHMGYMAAGLAVAVLGVLAVATLFFGWWELGRKVTMSPVEIARAFDAPLLRGVDGNAEIKDMLRQTDSISIRYGEVPGAYHGKEGSCKLRFEDASIVKGPQDGKTYRS